MTKISSIFRRTGFNKSTYDESRVLVMRAKSGKHFIPNINTYVNGIMYLNSKYFKNPFSTKKQAQKAIDDFMKTTKYKKRNKYIITVRG